jgi:uncharacterized DUF497 family protein
MVYTFIQYEWNLAKAESNFRKHGIRFEDATLAFGDPDVLFLPDPNHSTEFERREQMIGESNEKILSVSFTIRIPDFKSRIISARLANRKERNWYEKAKKRKEKALSE